MGPLTGRTIIEIAGIGPGPFAGMLLADMGARVIRIERPGGSLFSNAQEPRLDFLNRGKPCLALDLKHPDAVAAVLKMLPEAHGLIEGNRPGVMERLGLGPDVCLATNPALVYGRMTGWGQQGPWAQKVGHDINYVALSGALHPMGRAGEKPAIPLNLVGDFGGGGLMLAFGIVAALLEATGSGKGQVVDAAMIDGAATLMASTFAASQAGFWRPERGTNFLDGGAHFYEVYETSDGQYLSLGAIEPQFYAELLDVLEENASEFANQWDMDNWPAMKEKLARIIRTRPLAEWDTVFNDRDVCYAPVLSIDEVRQHPHHQARSTFVDDGDYWQPAPAPRFSRTPGVISGNADRVGGSTETVLSEFGFDVAEIEQLLTSGAAANHAAEPA